MYFSVELPVLVHVNVTWKDNTCTFLKPILRQEWYISLSMHRHEILPNLSNNDFL